MRIKELDYLKCMLIMLMVAFHLVYIGDSYPMAKKVVYTFHMPAFLLISGYLTNVNKKAREFARSMFWIFVPYALMEMGYTYMASLLPVRENVEGMSALLTLKNIFISPIGPYWYLHTLVLCSIAYYIIYNKCPFLKKESLHIILGLCLYALSCCSLLSFGNAIYYLIGVIIRKYDISFMKVFPSSWFALVPFILLCSYQDNLDRATLGGIAVTYCAIGILGNLHGMLPATIKSLSYFVGRNTFVILLFSPIFTFISKYALPAFSFDPSGLCFMACAILATICGCMSIAYCCDKLHISKLFFGKKVVLSPFSLK